MPGAASATVYLELERQWSSVTNLDLTCQVSGILRSRVSFNPAYNLVDAISIRRAARVFSTGSGPIFIDNLDCESDERNLLACPHNVLHQCQHADEAGVQCFGIIT